MFDLTAKTALVTGASGGLGGAIARALHRQGAIVALSGTRRDALDGRVRHALPDDAEVVAVLLAQLRQQGVVE